MVGTHLELDNYLHSMYVHIMIMTNIKNMRQWRLGQCPQFSGKAWKPVLPIGLEL